MSKVGHNRIQLGDDSDPNKNFVIGTPSPNDGTLEVRKGTVEVPGDLVARFKDSATDVGDLVKYEQAFGVGMSLKDMLSERELDVNYTNTTGKTIVCFVKGSTSASNGYLAFYLGPNIIGVYERSIAFSSVGACIVVPPLQSIRVTAVNCTLDYWSEYRP